MIVQSTYNLKTTEYNRFTDIIEDLRYKGDNTLTTPLEVIMYKRNLGKQKRDRNGHAERLAQFKAKAL